VQAVEAHLERIEAVNGKLNAVIWKRYEKAREEARAAEGDNHSMAGTPLYMSPEAIQMPGSVDACSDIYAVGATGYFLLTGRPVFEASSVVELCEKQVSETPVPPSTRSGRPIPPDLESALLACLEKSRAKRPQTARDLAQRLARCAAAIEWTIDDAETWWSRHERGQAPSGPTLGDATSASGAFAATIAH
jgi:serine/threonine protein kinase